MLVPFFALSPAPQLSAKPGPLGPPTPLPPAVAARLDAPQTWRVGRVASPRTAIWNPEKVAMVVDGKRVVLTPRDGFNKIQGVERGRDGSLLVHRARIGDPRWDFGDFIWYRGQERPIEGADVYRDRLNYAGSFIRETNAMGMPESAAEGHVVERGKARPLGWGSVRAWTPDGTFVLEVTVDERGQPSGTEFTTGSVTRILRKGREWRVPDYGFLGRTKGGTIVLSAGATTSSVGNGFVSLSTRSVASDRVLLWRDGRFVAHVALPPRWRVAGLAPDGWILARRRPETRPQPAVSLEGKKPEEAFAEMERRSRAEDDESTQAERDWTAGVLRGDKLTPVSFPKPRGTERLLWRGGATAYGPEAFRFTAFWGEDERTYRVARR